MGALEDFIDEHYIGPEREELINLLYKYELDSALAKIVTLYKQQLLQPAGVAMPLVSNFASVSLIAINQKMPFITDTYEKQKVKRAISGISIRLLLTFIRKSPNVALEVVDNISQSLKMTCSVMGYDYADLQQYFSPEQFRFFVQEISGENAAKAIRKKTNVQIKRLEWAGKGFLDYLSHEMKRREWIERKVQWTNFLDPNKTPGVVLCSAKGKLHISHLLFSLYSEQFIRPKGSRGYFSIAQLYLRDHSGQPFTQNSLKKLSSKIILSPEKYIAVRDEVERIMERVRVKARDYSGD